MKESGVDGFSLARIREIDMVVYLDKLGHQPEAVKKNGTDFWYRSPLRDENEPSFHVNQVTNEWYDFPLAKGGNVVDFCLMYYRCSITELLQKFNEDLSNSYLPVFDPSLHEGKTNADSKLVVTGVREIFAYPLKNYLHERSIPVAVASLFCKEVSYEINGHSYYGIGFKNDSGGYEIRNKNYKQSSAPKDITRLNYSSAQVNVFEGFMDFLSSQVLHPAMDRAGLNSWCSMAQVCWTGRCLTWTNLKRSAFGSTGTLRGRLIPLMPCRGVHGTRTKVPPTANSRI
jgi:hypothetical protein